MTFTVTPANNGATATFANNGDATTTGGVATMTATANATVGGPYTVTATSNGHTATFSLTNTPGLAASLAPNPTTPQSAAVGADFPTLSVTVKDAGGNPVADGTTVSFTVTAAGNGASVTFPNNGNATTTGGIASIVPTANGTAGGPYTVTATSNGHAATFQLTNTPGQPGSIDPSAGTPQSAQVGAAFTTKFAATVTDDSGNAVGGVSVTFTANPANGAGGSFTGTATVNTNGSGVATAPAFTANTVAGAYTVTANLSSNPLGTEATFDLTNTPGPVASLTTGANTTPQRAAITTAFGTALSVTANDAHGNVVPGASITFTAPASGAGVATGTFAAGGTNVSPASSRTAAG